MDTDVTPEDSGLRLLFEMLVSAAKEGRRCPQRDEIADLLNKHRCPHMLKDPRGFPVHPITALARFKWVRVEVWGKNWRVVEIRRGPCTGMRTAPSPYRGGACRVLFGDEGFSGPRDALKDTEASTFLEDEIRRLTVLKRKLGDAIQALAHKVAILNLGRPLTWKVVYKKKEGRRFIEMPPRKLIFRLSSIRMTLERRFPKSRYRVVGIFLELGREESEHIPLPTRYWA